MGKIQKILDKNSVEVYPVTHERAVKDSNGVTLETKLDEIRREVTNPEWIYVITDSENKIICGIKLDGSIEWSTGVPSPIKEYVESLGILIDAKVDKVPGESLIDEEIASSLSFQSNPDYIRAITDVDGRILEGITETGIKKLFIPTEFDDAKGNVLHIGELDIKESGRNKLIQECSPYLLNGAANIESVARLGYDIGSPDTPPENSLAGFNEAYRHNYRTMLADVRWTADGVPVCLHDETINAVARNADGTTISGDVYLKDITLAQVDEYDFGIIKGQKYAGLKIMRLYEFVKWCKFMNVKCYLEVKDFEHKGVNGTLSAEEWKSITDIIDGYGMQNRVTFLLDQPYGQSLAAATLVHQTYPDSDLAAHRITGNWESDCAAWSALQNGKNEVFWYFYDERVMTGIIPDELIAAAKQYGQTIGYTEIHTLDQLKIWLTDTNNLVCTRVAIRIKPIHEFIFELGYENI